HVHAELVHQAQPPAVQVHDAVADFDPGHLRKEPLRVHQRVVDGEVLFEADLALHGVPSGLTGILRKSCQKTKVPAKNESPGKKRKPPEGGFFSAGSVSFCCCPGLTSGEDFYGFWKLVEPGGVEPPTS